MTEITRISSKGQVVIPRELRKKLGLGDGDSLQVEQVGDLLVLKKINLSSLEEELRGEKK